MDKNMMRQIAWVAAVLVLVLAAAVLGVKYPIPPQPELVAETSRVGVNVRTEKALQVENYIIDNGTLDVNGATSLDGALTVGGKTPLLTNGLAGTSQSWDIATYEWHYEGTTADAHEVTVRWPANPTADAVYVWPEYGGYVGLNQADSLMTVHGSSVVTGTATLTHSLATPLYAFCTMGTDPVNDEEDRCTVTISGTTVTAKVWKEAATPTAGDSGVTVYWQVVGTP